MACTALCTVPEDEKASAFEGRLLVQGLEVGQRAHGCVTGAKEYGVFVNFCGGVKGLVPVAELGLEPSQDASSHFPVGKVGLPTLPLYR